jgi:AcrR family transcriptional regulator
MTADPEAEQTAQQIIAVASRLFAQLGYDGTSVQLISDAAGVAPATVTALAGTKTDLYRTVVGRVFEAEQAAVMSVVGSFTPTRTTLARILDAYLDFYVENPYVVKLWLQRRMGDAADVADLETLYVRPSFLAFADVLHEAAPQDVDVDYVIWTIIWLVSGFLSTGIMHSRPLDHPHGTRLHITPEDLDDFRAYLHEVIRRMLPLPD